MTMDEIVRRLEAAEKKIAALEATLETIKQMNVSDQMRGYIESRQNAVQFAGLLNSLSQQSPIDTSEAQRQIAQAQARKDRADRQVREAMAAAVSDNAAATPASMFRYQECKEGTLTGLEITGFNGFDEKVIAIPASIAGRPVIRIGKSAFQGCTMEEVILPSSLVAIGPSAFKSCEKLKKINFPAGVKVIPESCCDYCDSLADIRLEEGLTEIQKRAFCFIGDNKCRSIVIPKSVKKIKIHAFFGRDGMAAAVLGMDTTADIGAFYGCKLYVIPGSAMQSYARKESVPVRPLSEFPQQGR